MAHYAFSEQIPDSKDALLHKQCNEIPYMTDISPPPEWTPDGVYDRSRTVGLVRLRVVSW